MQFLKKVVEMMSYEITSLDQPFHDATGHRALVWERLMEIRSMEHPYLSQFVNVAPQYNNAGVVFTFIPQLESEARSHVASIIPYFWYEYGDGVEKFFNAEAWEMHMDMEWDPETQSAVTPDDQRVEDIMEQDPEYQWEDLKNGEDVGKQKEDGKTQHLDPKEKSLYGDDDGDSISMMCSVS
jgi:hypothetical protein